MKAAKGAVDVDVDVTQQVALHDQRDDQPAALVERRRAFRRVAQLHGAASPHLGEPRGYAFQQRALVLAGGHERARDRKRVALVLRLREQQHALGARELGDLVDQELGELRFALDLVEAQSGVDEALERRAQADFSHQVRLALPLGQLPLACMREPREAISRLSARLLR